MEPDLRAGALCAPGRVVVEDEPDEARLVLEGGALVASAFALAAAAALAFRGGGGREELALLLLWPRWGRRGAVVAAAVAVARRGGGGRWRERVFFFLKERKKNEHVSARERRGRGKTCRRKQQLPKTSHRGLESELPFDRPFSKSLYSSSMEESGRKARARERERGTSRSCFQNIYPLGSEQNSPKTVLGLPPLFRSSWGCSIDGARRFVRPAVRWATSGEAESGSLLEVVVVVDA